MPPPNHLLTEEERDRLRDWWDEETTMSVESVFPIVARIVRAHEAKALREAAEFCTPKNWTGPPATLIHLNHWLNVRADRIEGDDA